VGAFLAGTVGFPDIADLVEHALERVPADPLESLEQVLDADRRAREAVTDAMRTAA
jgi:1-deoxy-D-xylulose 5-phosphate reductoisomerase